MAFLDGEGKGGVVLGKGDVFGAGVEADEGAALVGGAVADGAAEGGVAGFDGVEDVAEGGVGFAEVEGELALHPGQIAQVVGEDDADHGRRRETQGRVWTSTERTAGRSWTMGCQWSPESGET